MVTCCRFRTPGLAKAPLLATLLRCFFVLLCWMIAHFLFSSRTGLPACTEHGLQRRVGRSPGTTLMKGNRCVHSNHEPALQVSWTWSGRTDQRYKWLHLSWSLNVDLQWTAYCDTHRHVPAHKNFKVQMLTKICMRSVGAASCTHTAEKSA